MEKIGSISYGISAASYLILCLMLLMGWRDRPQKTAFVLAAAVSAVWAAVMAYNTHHALPTLAIDLAELARDVTWLVFLLRLLENARDENDRRAGWWRFAAISTCGFSLLLLTAGVWDQYARKPWLLPGHVDPVTIAFLSLAVTGLVLTEQVFRNARSDALRSIKYLCLGIGGVFAYDFYLYANALMLHGVSVSLWLARGAIDALIVPILAVAIIRDSEWSRDIFISRRVVFRTSALLGAAIYLFAMGAGGYYVRHDGGTWGVIAQTIFLFGAGLLLLILLFSTPLRAQLRVLINKHFFRYKYDYREEWLRFIRTLSSNGSGAQLHERAILALAQIVGSPGGVLFMRADSGNFEAVSHSNMTYQATAREPVNGAFSSFLEKHEWVVNLDEHEGRDESGPQQLAVSLVLPGWLREFPQAWLVVPLIIEDRLLGFTVLTQPRARYRDFNWEDCDLLKTVGRQVASHLLQCETARALADARQFETLNRLSAFVVHDLKNLVAQLSLAVSNANRHSHNPLFVQDVIRTVDNSVAKMNRLLSHLRAGGTPVEQKVQVDLAQLLKETVKAYAANHPTPRLEGQIEGTIVMADRDRLSAVVGHIIQNAQDATSPEGRIVVRAERNGKYVSVDVEDTGSGMDESFIRERLFRPFDTTKGNSGMGVGAYETREFVRALGGDVQVYSQPGQGTTFRIQIPYLDVPQGNVRYLSAR
ncbi:MAG: XrtA/PEP-CTERM system histidine kinase PrsK [Acidiferrobacteraceae bacterium]